MIYIAVSVGHPYTECAIYNTNDTTTGVYPEKIAKWLFNNAVCENCGLPFNRDLKPCSCLSEEDKSEKLIGTYIFPYEKSSEFTQLQFEFNRACRRKVSEYNRKERMKKVQGKHRPSDIRKLWELQNKECYYCDKKLSALGTNGFCRDHITPITDGGTDWISNIDLLCHKCNRKKYNKSADDFWEIIEKEFGKRFVKKKKAFNNSIQEQKMLLSQKSKKEILEKLNRPHSKTDK